MERNGAQLQACVKHERSISGMAVQPVAAGVQWPWSLSGNTEDLFPKSSAAYLQLHPLAWAAGGEHNSAKPLSELASRAGILEIQLSLGSSQLFRSSPDQEQLQRDSSAA